MSSRGRSRRHPRDSACQPDMAAAAGRGQGGLPRPAEARSGCYCQLGERSPTRTGQPRFSKNRKSRKDSPEEWRV